MTSQRQFTTALIDPGRPVPQGLVSPRGTPDAKRFAVYRNNVHVSLVEAVAARFPVTRQLVGEEFFTGMARVYVGENKPQSPVMLHYGDSFPDFVAGFPPASTVPYLADVARLEAAWSDAYNAADHATLQVAELGAVPPQLLAEVILQLAPPTRFLRSRFPVGTIWSAHQARPVVIPAVKGGECVLLTRPAADVRVTVIPSADLAFLEFVQQGKSLSEAAEAVLTSFPDFDPGAALVGLAGLGAFAVSQAGASK
ncbi:DNA-binding domain-containing protein [uncultured Devosia sp.]|uniref:HvfC/BufC N-terminal domain-containing protein n=1 Tax=uncultured Devosia sp. TaxID=211434 RepID=UPI0026035528|nr:DNA-binding domain-containing protein [uncultured Devosia sp.]